MSGVGGGFEKADIRIKAQNLNILSHIFLENNSLTAFEKGDYIFFDPGGAGN